MKNLKISAATLKKLKDDHNVERTEVEQAFQNRYAGLLEDMRIQHKTNPPTLWFIAPTNKGRRLKVVYIQNGADIDLKSTFDPNLDEERIYTKYA